MIFELNHSPGPGALVLGPLTGVAEIAVTSANSVDAIAVVDACLLDQTDGLLKPGQAALMTVSDRDRLMAFLHRQTFGPNISGNAVCHGCEDRFDFDFDLDQLLGAAAPTDDQTADAQGWYQDGDTRFRLPTGADELAARGMAANDAANVIALRCAPDSDVKSRAQISSRVAAIAPLVDMTLLAPCPDCGTKNPMKFAAERYFLTALLNDKHRLLREVHLLGATYHWPLHEILALSRDDRRGFAGQIERDREAVRKAGAA